MVWRQVTRLRHQEVSASSVNRRSALLVCAEHLAYSVCSPCFTLIILQGFLLTGSLLGHSILINDANLEALQGFHIKERIKLLSYLLMIQYLT